LAVFLVCLVVIGLDLFWGVNFCKELMLYLGYERSLNKTLHGATILTGVVAAMAAAATQRIKSDHRVVTVTLDGMGEVRQVRISVPRENFTPREIVNSLKPQLKITWPDSLYYFQIDNRWGIVELDPDETINPRKALRISRTPTEEIANDLRANTHQFLFYQNALRDTEPIVKKFALQYLMDPNLSVLNPTIDVPQSSRVQLVFRDPFKRDSQERTIEFRKEGKLICFEVRRSRFASHVIKGEINSGDDRMTEWIKDTIQELIGDTRLWRWRAQRLSEVNSSLGRTHRSIAFALGVMWLAGNYSLLTAGVGAFASIAPQVAPDFNLGVWWVVSIAAAVVSLFSLRKIRIVLSRHVIIPFAHLLGISVRERERKRLNEIEKRGLGRWQFIGMGTLFMISILIAFWDELLQWIDINILQAQGDAPSPGAAPKPSTLSPNEQVRSTIRAALQKVNYFRDHLARVDWVNSLGLSDGEMEAASQTLEGLIKDASIDYLAIDDPRMISIDPELKVIKVKVDFLPQITEEWNFLWVEQMLQLTSSHVLAHRQMRTLEGDLQIGLRPYRRGNRWNLKEMFTKNPDLKEKARVLLSLTARLRLQERAVGLIYHRYLNHRQGTKVTLYEYFMNQLTPIAMQQGVSPVELREELRAGRQQSLLEIPMVRYWMEIMDSYGSIQGAVLPWTIFGYSFQDRIVGEILASHSLMPYIVAYARSELYNNDPKFSLRILFDRYKEGHPERLKFTAWANEKIFRITPASMLPATASRIPGAVAPGIVDRLIRVLSGRTGLLDPYDKPRIPNRWQMRSS